MFRYVKNPRQILDYLEKGKKCGVCQSEKPGYGGAYHHSGDNTIDFVCEDCLSDGKLRKEWIQTNEGSFAVLSKQLKELNSNLEDKEIERIAGEKTEEIEYRTPPYSSWQEHNWPVHHGDYCVLIGEIGKEELNALAQDGNGRKFLDDVLYWTETDYDKDEQWDDKYKDWLWEYLPDHTPRKGKEFNDSTSPLILFQCTEGREYVAILDFD